MVYVAITRQFFARLRSSLLIVQQEENVLRVRIIQKQYINKIQKDSTMRKKESTQFNQRTLSLTFFCMLPNLAPTKALQLQIKSQPSTDGECSVSDLG